ncbi:hypothetical protein JCM33374_g4581 [Metschnikowia sp. JCM 33374]|nr:hypothetical protein JCM33374_g4581 [Metschnikowia sp. JCM 33374]
MEEPPILNIQLREVSKSITDLVIDTLEDDKHKAELRDARTRVIDEYEEATKAKRLFRDAFNSAPTLIDRSDGVPRCGNCHWEAHGSVCLHCGTRFRTPHDDSYYDTDDGDAYNEDREEIEMSEVDAPNYDSEDSFVDNREMYEINNDLEESDDLLSTDDNHSEAEPWEGFRQESEIYRSHDHAHAHAHAHAHDENVDYGDREEADLSLPQEIGSQSESEHDDGIIYLDDHAEVASQSGSDNQNPYYYSDDDEQTYNDQMEDAVEELHDQDVEDYSRHYEPDFDEGSDSDWGTSVAMGRRPVHIYDSDSE